MPDDDQMQIVVVLPGGGFIALGLIDSENLDPLMSCLASLDCRAGRSLRPSDVRRAYLDAKALQARAAAAGNNDHDADGA